MSAQVDLTHLPEEHPLHGVHEVPCKISGLRLDIAVREDVADSLPAMLQYIGAMDAEGNLLPGVHVFPVPAPVLTPAVWSEPVWGFATVWVWATETDEFGHEYKMLDDDGEPYKVETDQMVEVVKTPAEIITPAVVDTRPHYNIVMLRDRVTAIYEGDDPALSWGVGLPSWQVFAMVWKLQGTDSPANHGETAKALSGVAAIYPDTISSPSHVIA